MGYGYREVIPSSRDCPAAGDAIDTPAGTNATLRGLVTKGQGQGEHRRPDQKTAASPQSRDCSALGVPSGVCTHGAAADVDGWLPDAAAKRQALECRNKSRADTAECCKAALTR